MIASAAAALTITQGIAAAAPTLPYGYVIDVATKEPVPLAMSRADVAELAAGNVMLFPTTVDRHRPWTEGYLPPGFVYPISDGAHVVDDRYFTDAARAKFWPCVQERYALAAGEGPAAVDALVASCMSTVWSRVGDPCRKPAQVPALCTDLGYHTSWCGRKDRPAAFTKQSTCFAPIDQAVAAAGAPHDDIAVPPITYDGAGVATTHEHETGPGVRIYDRDDYFEWDDYIPFDSAAFAALRGPSRMTSPPAAGATTPPPGATSSLVQVVIAPGVDLANRAAYATNGMAIGSCAEYAVEKHLEFALLDDWERQRSRTPKEIYGAIYQTTEAGGPFVTAAGDFDFRARGGGLACTGTAATCDFDPTAAVATGGLREPLWGVSARTTYKNVYAYARHILAADADLTLTDDQRRARYRSAEQHYTVDDRWHKRMGTALAAYHPDLLEDLRDQQRPIWAMVIDYEGRRDYLDTLRKSPQCVAGWRPSGAVQFCTTQMKEADAAAAIATARAALQAAIAPEAARCPVTGPAQETPCDWAPSRAVDSVHAYFEKQMLNAYNRCVSKHDTGPLVEAAIERTYLHPGLFEPTPIPSGRYPSGTATTCPLAVGWAPVALTATQRAACEAACPIDGAVAMPTATTGPATAACRALFLSTNPLSSPAALEAHWYNEPRYVDLIALSLHETYDGIELDHDAGYAKTIGNSYFGLATSFESSTGVDDTYRRHICDQQPYSRDDTSVSVGMFGTSYDVLNSALETNPPASQVEHFSSPSTWTASAGFSCERDPATCLVTETTELDSDVAQLARDTRIGANFVQTQNESRATVSANMPLVDVTLGVGVTVYVSVGPFMVFVRAQALGSTGAGVIAAASARASRSPVDGCRGFDFTTSFGVTAYANIGAGVAAGISVGLPGFSIDAGVRGRLNLIDATLTASVATQARSEYNYEGEPTSALRLTFGVDASGHLFSGSLSLFIEMTLAFITVPLYELVIAQWKGPGVNYSGQASLGTDGAQSSGGGWVDKCLLNSLQVLWGDVSRRTDGCPCYPWDDATAGVECGAP